MNAVLNALRGRANKETQVTQWRVYRYLLFTEHHFEVGFSSAQGTQARLLTGQVLKTGFHMQDILQYD